MKRYIKSARPLKVNLLIRTALACLIMTALSVAAPPTRAVDAEADARKALENLKAALDKADQKQKDLEKAQKALDKARGETMKDGKVTADEKELLQTLENGVAEAEAALKAAEAEVQIALRALEDALEKLKEDSEVKKELKRQRDILLGSRFGNSKTKVVSSNGLRTVKFDMPPGEIRVYLPADMAAGDTISGTVVAEPRGHTDSEREKNRGELNGYVVELEGQKISDRPTFQWTPSKPQANAPVKYQLKIFEVLGSGGHAHESVFDIPVATVPPMPVPTQFQIPTLGQTGRNVQIAGPFDGNSANTGVTVGTQTVTPIAESRSECVIESPTNVTGPTEIKVKEGNVETRSQYRNVGVGLSAPKTNLQKGESTTLTVQVLGLQGITQPVPLTLESSGVITMDGGNYQPLMIQASQVGADGSFSTTRGITGLQPGGWTASATVVTGRFNICLQDDSIPSRVVLWNTFTGEYVFNCPGCPSTGATTLGKGLVTIKGCIITVEDNTPDRRVTARLDQCSKSGSAAVDTAPKIKFTITDRNTADNICTMR